MKRITVVLIALLAGLASAEAAWLNIRLNNDSTTQLQNEEQIVVNPNDPDNMVAVWRDFRLGWREIAFATTFDGWQTVARETLFYAHGSDYVWDSDPGLTVDSAGNFYAVILSFNSTSEPNALYVLKSTDGGLTWGPKVPVIQNVPGVFEDKELIGCDRTGSPYKDYLYVPWSRDGYTIMNARSTNGGASFEAPVTVSSSGVNQWPVPAVGPQGEVYVGWIDYGYNRMMLNKSTNGGSTFLGQSLIQNTTWSYGDVNGGITTFSYPAIDVDITAGPRRGWVYIVYTDCEQGTVSETDMFFTRSTDGGTTWSAPLRVNDDQLNNRRDQFHPWLTIDRTGRIHACWLDRRLDPANIMMDCYYSYSADGGTTWAPNQRISTVSSDPRLDLPEDSPWQPGTPRPFAGHLGEYIGIAASDSAHIYPLWTDCRLGNQDAFVARMDSMTNIAQSPARPGLRPLLSAVPNPFTGYARVPGRESASFCVYDIAGNRVGTYPGARVGNDLLPGVYFLHESGHNSVPLRLQKVK
jgi:hypothetical protein